MPTTCVFLYDRPNSVYYSGEVINGKIVLTTDKIKKVRGIYITIKGEAKVRWTEQKTRHNQHTNKEEHYTVEYRGDQQYLYSQTLADGEMDLSAGIHEYTFTVPLPVQVPSSITDTYGHVSYEVELKLDRPMRIDNTYSNGFTVIRPLNLNFDPAYAQPLVGEDEKYFCCFWCASGPILSELRTEFAGYAPGQQINFTLTVENESNDDISEYTVEFVQTVFFESHSPEHKTKSVDHVIGSKGFPGANRLCKKVHHGSIQVPPVPPTTVNSSDIIRVAYSLKAIGETGCCSTNIAIYVGISIGTVPLMASATNPNSVITVQPTAPLIDPNGENDDKPPQYGSIVPPSFEEATGMNNPFKDEEADQTRVMDPFVPKYPTYHNFATPSAPSDGQQDDKKASEALLQTTPTAPSLPCPSGTTQTTSSSQPSNLPPYPVHGFSMPVPGVALPMQPENISNQKGAPSLGWRS